VADLVPPVELDPIASELVALYRRAVREATEPAASQSARQARTT